MPRVFLLRQMPDDVVAKLSQTLDVGVWKGEGRISDEELAKELATTNGFLGIARWTADLMDKAPNLKVIANTAVGFDNVDVAAATKRGIVVTNTPGVLTDTTADLAWSILMSAARRISEGERFVRAGQWGKPGTNPTFLGLDVHHKTLGLIGLGRIGAEVAHRATGFHMKVLYYDVVRKPELEEKYGYQFTDIETILRESDFVSLHLFADESTRGFMGEKQFGMMKPSAIFVNAARGALVDEPALIKALQEKKIAAAALDVFAKEPTDADNPLLKMENVVAVPHLGSATAATRRLMLDLAVDNTIAVLNGQRPITPVNPEVLAK